MTMGRRLFIEQGNLTVSTLLRDDAISPSVVPVNY